MQRYLVSLLMLALTGVVSAQTETPTPVLSVSGPYVFATLTGGQMSRFDYVASAGSVHISNLLTALLFSLWGMFLLTVFIVAAVLWKRRRK